MYSPSQMTLATYILVAVTFHGRATDDHLALTHTLRLADLHCLGSH